MAPSRSVASTHHGLGGAAGNNIRAGHRMVEARSAATKVFLLGVVENNRSDTPISHSWIGGFGCEQFEAGASGGHPESPPHPRPLFPLES